jgi:hypothetical protein
MAFRTALFCVLGCARAILASVAGFGARYRLGLTVGFEVRGAGLVANDAEGDCVVTEELLDDGDDGGTAGMVAAGLVERGAGADCVWTGWVFAGGVVCDAAAAGV